VVHPGPITETITALSASTVFGLGLGLAYLLFGPQRKRAPMRDFLHQLWFAGWGFDWIYHRLLVRPFLWVTRQVGKDPADVPIRSLGEIAMLGNRALCLTQSGRVRWYAAGLAMGTVAVLAVAVFLR
jgi:NADH-quinone oxidoreductase subunit L